MTTREEQLQDATRQLGGFQAPTGPNPKIEIREPGAKNRIYESMTRVKHYDCTVRVWCREDGLKMAPRYAIINDIKSVPRHWDLQQQAEHIAAVLDRFPEVSAYEILDDLGNGGVVYPDWP